jgi:hypothetical protein
MQNLKQRLLEQRNLEQRFAAQYLYFWEDKQENALL